MDISYNNYYQSKRCSTKEVTGPSGPQGLPGDPASTILDSDGNLNMNTGEIYNCRLLKNAGENIEINGNQINLNATTIDLDATTINLDAATIDLLNTTTTTATPDHNANIKTATSGLVTNNFLKVKLNGDYIWIPYFVSNPSLVA